MAWLFLTTVLLLFVSHRAFCRGVSWCAVVVVLLLLMGCAAHSGIVPIGPDTYMVSRQAATGFPGAGTLKADAFREAHAFCLSQQKQLQVVQTAEAQPPYVLGNFPRAEVQFMCLDASDPALARPTLHKAPDSVLDIRR